MLSHYTFIITKYITFLIKNRITAIMTDFFVPRYFFCFTLTRLKILNIYLCV